MSDPTKMSDASFFGGARRQFCMAPDVHGLTPEQLAALHAFRGHVLTHAVDLYAAIPEERADPILRNFFRTLVDGPPPT